MGKYLIVSIIIFCFLNTAWFSGQTYEINVEDVSNYYSTVEVKNAKEILISNFKDMRKKRNIVGNLGQIRFVADMPVNDAFAARIAARFKTNGFNIRKKNINLKQKKIIRTMKQNRAEVFISGAVFVFYFSGVDLVSGKTTGKSAFNIIGYDANGAVVFDKYYFLTVERDISASPIKEAELLVDDLFNGSADVLFDDADFLKTLNLTGNKYKTLKDSPYYDKKLSDEVNTLLLKYKDHKIDKREFIKLREKTFNSFNS